MPDYSITLQFYGLTIGNGTMTGNAIARALETLIGSSPDIRLHYAAIQGGPSGGSAMTAEDIINVLNAYVGDDKIKAGILKELTKLLVSHAEGALNKRGAGNVVLGSWQSANMTGIWANDFWVASGVTEGLGIDNGDIVVAKVNAPASFNYNDASQWWVLRFSLLSDDNKAPVLFIRHGNYYGTDNGIEAKTDNPAFANRALGFNSFVSGRDSFTGVPAIGANSMGISAGSIRIGERSLASGKFVDRGDAQFQEYIMRHSTSNASPAIVVLPNPYTLDSTKTFKMTVEGVARYGEGLNSRSWEWNFLVSRTKNGVILSTLPQTPVSQSIGSALCNAYLTANNTTKKLEITVQGETGKNINWVFYIRCLTVKTQDIQPGVDPENAFDPLID